MGAQRGQGGVTAIEREGFGIALVTARKGRAAEVAERIRDTLGIVPENAPRRVRAGEVAVSGIGPETWLVTREGTDDTLAQSLRSLLGGCASVVDQSDAYAMLRLAGPGVRETLAKLVPIDLHARAFRVDDVAQTVCGYVNVILWRLGDGAQDGPVFEIWAGRSFADSLHRMIAQGAAEFGFVRKPDREIA